MCHRTLVGSNTFAHAGQRLGPLWVERVGDVVYVCAHFRDNNALDPAISFTCSEAEWEAVIQAPVAPAVTAKASKKKGK